MISLRRELQESELVATCLAALLKAFKGVATAVASTAQAANPDLAQQCREALDLATDHLHDRPPASAIEEAQNIALAQIEKICSSNQAALEERDAAVKDVVAMVAAAVGTFKGNGETHKLHLTQLADEFDVLSHIENPAELRRRLNQGVENLRQSVGEMDKANEALLRQFESQMAEFRQRLELARKDTGTDRLTGLGSRLQASRHLRTLASSGCDICLQLFDIEGFGEINKEHGTLFGDRLLISLAHLLTARFSGNGGVFRWAADEFLAIGEVTLPRGVELCKEIQRSFADDRYLTVRRGINVTLRADVAFGVAKYNSGEGIDLVYQRAREALELNRKAIWR